MQQMEWEHLGSPTSPPLHGSGLSKSSLCLLKSYTYVSALHQSGRKLDEHTQGHTEQDEAQAQVQGLKCQVVLFIVEWIHADWWKLCVWERKGNCITKITGPSNPWKGVEAVWTKEGRFQGYCKMKWTSHNAQNYKGEASFPLKISRNKLLLGGELVASNFLNMEEEKFTQLPYLI